MGLFNLFGGKKKDEVAPAKAAAAPKPESKSAAGKTVVVFETATTPAAGAAQVKLRLKLVQSLRSRRTAVAYEAAKELAAIQAKAGRRLGARLWTAEAERIKAGLSEEAAA